MNKTRSFNVEDGDASKEEGDGWPLDSFMVKPGSSQRLSRPGKTWNQRGTIGRALNPVGTHQPPCPRGDERFWGALEFPVCRPDGA